jgi:hypothetical protein
MISWPDLLLEHERQICGPEDEFDERVNGDPDSTLGEDDESGFDEMSPAVGWDDESDEEEDEDDDE